MSGILAIAGTALRRFFRDRSNYFFVFVFPLLLVVLIGLQFGEQAGGGSAVVIGSSSLADDVSRALDDDGLGVTRSDDLEDARTLVARGRSDVAVVVSDDAGATFAVGDPATIEVIAGSQASGVATQQRVQTTLDAVARRADAVRALVDAGLDPQAASDGLDDASDLGASLEVSTVGDDLDQAFQGLGQFDLGAAQQLSLFVFLSSLAGASFLIQSREYGVTRRQLAAPMTAGRVIVGEALGRFVIALTQGLYIVAGTALLFGVDWGDPLATGVVLAAFCAVSASAAMVFGAMLDNANVAGGVGVGAGLVLAALGGSMLPLELFPDSLLAVSRVTPHHWAYEAYAAIQRRGATLADVLGEVGVLVAMTAVLLPLGAWLLRRSLERAL